jgi:toxin ParE1/3/4
MNVRWLKRALRDVEKAGLYIARERPRTALRWAEGVIVRMRQVGELPESGRMVPEIGNPRIREIVHQDVRVIYRIDSDEIVVMIAWHTRRDVRKLIRLLEPFRVPRLMDTSA